MSGSLSKSLHLSSTLKIESEAMVMSKKQGIVSILGSDSTKSAPSLRRTLSADMSSKKWLSENGFSGSPMKKTASSEEFPVSISDEDEQERKEGHWSSIQQENNKKEIEKPGQFDIWSSILSQKKQDDDSKSLPPYIHPLVKKSASSLSGKSLEICTESLGSETGSDGFSSYPPSESGEEDKEEQQEREEEERVGHDFEVVKYNYVVGKKLPQRPLPPPIPSLSHTSGSSLRMRSRRDNGRLVLEAVSLPSQNNFKAQRQNGRLVLSFVDTLWAENEQNKIEDVDEEEENESEEIFGEEFNGEAGNESEMEEEPGETEEVDEENKGDKEMRVFIEKQPKLPSGVINVHRLALMVNKPIGLANKSPTWANKFNEAQIFEKPGDEDEIESIEPTLLAKSLPPRPPTAARRIPPSSAKAVASRTATKAAASFNVYDYYWRREPMSSPNPPPPPKTNGNKLVVSKNPIPNEQQELVVLRGNEGDYLVPLVKTCKERRRSLLFWEPYCIATS